MKVYLNGRECERDCETIQHLWEIERHERAIKTSRGVAIALNGAMVRKDQWSRTPIVSGDRIEIVRAMSGG